MPFGSVAEVEKALRAESYLPDRGLATAIFLATSMGRPLLLEGEAGVGKTEVGKTLARILDADLIRLQCYEGIDASQALYEWDYARQLLYARALQEGEVGAGDRVAELYGPEFLVERPLLRAIRAGSKAVLLVDELDRADDEFEAFLLEVLSDFTVTVPELSTIAASEPPAVVITSNRTRELHDALKRRCLYHWIDFPDVEREAEIIRLRAPGVEEALARSVAETVSRLRALDLVKRPGAAEAIDWAQALSLLGATSVDGGAGRETLGAAVKNREDQARVEAAWPELVDLGRQTVGHDAGQSLGLVGRKRRQEAEGHQAADRPPLLQADELHVRRRRLPLDVERDLDAERSALLSPHVGKRDLTCRGLADLDLDVVLLCGHRLREDVPEACGELVALKRVAAAFERLLCLFLGPVDARCGADPRVVGLEVAAFRVSRDRQL